MSSGQIWSQSLGIQPTGRVSCVLSCSLPLPGLQLPCLRVSVSSDQFQNTGRWQRHMNAVLGNQVVDTWTCKRVRMVSCMSTRFILMHCSYKLRICLKFKTTLDGLYTIVCTPALSVTWTALLQLRYAACGAIQVLYAFAFVVEQFCVWRWLRLWCVAGSESTVREDHGSGCWWTAFTANGSRRRGAWDWKRLQQVCISMSSSVQDPAMLEWLSNNNKMTIYKAQ